ncbi:MAG: holo-ACP synthase [Lachnospiraceae bacterium]|nr:holo-ACP synthase [Lachnospiraceae bacterium]
MIVGIGTDMIEIDRVVKACEKEAFLLRTFTKEEVLLIKKDKRKSADNFAVKEAVSKMFGIGFRGISLPEIEVLRDSLGKPYVNLYGKAKKMADQIGVKKIHVSITNTKELAQAFVVGEGE